MTSATHAAGTPGEIYQRDTVPAEAVRDWVDDEGLGFPMVSHVVTARR
jgi:hypothetical protein